MAQRLGLYPCNADAAGKLYDSVPEIFSLKDLGLDVVDGTGITYAEYVLLHADEWKNIMTNLGFFWSDPAYNAQEPVWENLDWKPLLQ